MIQNPIIFSCYKFSEINEVFFICKNIIFTLEKTLRITNLQY